MAKRTTSGKWKALRPVVEHFAEQLQLRELLDQFFPRQPVSLGILGTMRFRFPEEVLLSRAEGRGEGLWYQTVHNENLRMMTTVLITRYGEIWVGFETKDPGLAGKKVYFALREPENRKVIKSGEVTLVPVEQPGLESWEGRQCLGKLKTFPLPTEVILDFVIKDE